MPLEIISADVLRGVHDPIRSWPTEVSDQAKRLTPMCLPAIRPSFRINKDDLIFTIGSCFARNIEKQLIVEDFNVAARQFARLCEEEGCEVRGEVLNKYAAPSILSEMRSALDPGAPFDERLLVQFGTDRYVDMQLYSGIRAASLDKVRAVRRVMNRYMALLSEAKIIIITLGLAEAWFDKEVGVYLNRAPLKSAVELYPNRFELHVLSYEEITDALEKIIALLKDHGRPDYHILLTVSPVAMGNTWTDDDALTANCYSKSVQRAAATFLYKKYDCVDYLPSYESITLSDRKIAWRADAAHVTDEAVRINVLRMLQAYSGTSSSPEADQKHAIALQSTQDAQKALEEGRYEDALRDIQFARQAAPDEVAISHEYGAILFRTGRYEEALCPLQLAYKGGGAQYGSAELLGFALVILGRHEEGIPYLEEAVSLCLKKSKADRYLAEAYWRAGDTDRAISFIRETLRSARKRNTLPLFGAAILCEAGRYDEALEMVDAAVDEYPGQTALARLKEEQKRAIALRLMQDAETATKEGRHDDALRAIEFARKVAPD